MILKELKNLFHNELAFLYPKTEIDSFFYLSIDEYLNLQKIDTVLQSDFIVCVEKLKLFNSTIHRLKREEPIQYIFWKTEFYGFPFIVNKHTLIPRPETEELVSWVLDTIQESYKKRISILEIGTGTGCIPISIKKNLPNSDVFTVDISEKAIEIAKQNAKLNDVTIHFEKVDILSTSSLKRKYDIIISNPPYVRELEKEKMSNNVLNYEPENALFVKDNNPLIFYKKITELAISHLNKKGFLFFEINEYLGDETKRLIEEIGFKKVKIKKDIFGKDRMIKAST